MIRLGVNVDHVATLRQARGTTFPDPIDAARHCEAAGCASIVAHLREDRRHINNHDVERLKRVIRTKFNLEMSISRQILEIAKKIKPDEATLVPEKRAELTTEGGLDLAGGFEKIKRAVEELKGCNVQVSLFINPDIMSIRMAERIGARSVELHTGRYAEAQGKSRDRELRRLQESAKFAKARGFFVAAGHGLNYENVKPVAAIAQIEELNIGHSIICRAIFVGIKRATEEMLELARKARRTAQ